MSIFEQMTDQEIQEAQDKLNELCTKYDLEAFNIQEKDGLVCWRRLVQAMCGVNVEYKDTPGRKSHSDEFVDNVRRLDALYTDFSRFVIPNDVKNSEMAVHTQLPDFRRKEIYGFIADSLSKKYGKEISSDMVKGILNNKNNKDHLERLTKEEFKELETASFDPDEMPKT
jgi:hypothetical protein